MNIRKFFMPLAAVLLLFNACEKNNELGEAELTLSTSKIEFLKDGGSETITLVSNRDWSVKNRPEWLDISPYKGKASNKEQTITISVLKNDGAERSCIVTFAGTTEKQELAIVQAGDGSEPVSGETISCAEFLEKKDVNKEYSVKGKVGNISTGSKYYGFYVNDGTAELCCPFPANWDEFKDQIHTGSTVVIKGKYEYYEQKDQHQLKNGNIESLSEAAQSDIKSVSVAEFISKADSYNRYKLSGTVGGEIKPDYCSFTLQDDSGEILVYTVNNASEYGDKLVAGQKVTLIGAYTLYNGSKHEVVDADIVELEIKEVESKSAEGIVVAISKTSMLIKTETGYEYVYGEHSSKVGDKVKVTGDADEYNGVPQIKNGKVETISEGNTVTHPTPTVLDETSIDSYTTVFGYVQFQGSLNISSGKYYNLKVGNASHTGSLVAPVDIDASASGKILNVKGYFVGFSGNNMQYFNIVVTEFKIEGDVEINNADINPAADEIRMTLAKDEILAVVVTSANKYETFEIPSASGTWKANAYRAKNNMNFLQFRNKQQSFVSSPEFASEIKRVVIKYADGKITNTPKTIKAVPVVDQSSLPSDKEDSYNKHDELFTNAYGSFLFEVNAAQLVELKFPAGVKQFSLLPVEGAVYVEDIHVFIKK